MRRYEYASNVFGVESSCSDLEPDKISVKSYLTGYFYYTLD